jgi:hypothetical protein
VNKNQEIVEIKEEKFQRAYVKEKRVSSQCGWQRKETKEGGCQKNEFLKIKFAEEKGKWCEVGRFEVNTLIMILGKMDVEFFKCANK